MNQQLLELFYFQVTDIWQRFCDFHNELYNITLEEYTALLSSDIDKLEILIKAKEETIAQINDVEKIRAGLIAKINEHLEESEKIKSVKDLLSLMNSVENNSSDPTTHFLFKFNQLLIDLIEKIQAQNKKNQQFLNKAIFSLKEIREGMSGKKSYNVYNRSGATVSKDLTK